MLAPGNKIFDANTKQELGYDRYPNVVTAIEFERILSATGPYSGKVRRPSDSKMPKKMIGASAPQMADAPSSV